jgi:RNA-binding protein
MSLNARQRKHLRGLSHALQPVVTVADKGLTENVMAEIEIALVHHELVKIKLRADRDTRAALAEEISQRCRAERVHAIGQVVCYFRRNPEKPVIALPE